MFKLLHGFIMVTVFIALTSNVQAWSLPAQHNQFLERSQTVVDDESFLQYARSFVPRSSEEKDEANLLAARGTSCHHDYECGPWKYCSTKKHRCYQKRRFGASCSRDGACQTGYCGRRTFQCSAKKSLGRTCFGTNNACQSGYCSSASDKCTSVSRLGGKCTESGGCKSGKCSPKGRCVPKHQHNHPHPPPPVESGKNYHP